MTDDATALVERLMSEGPISMSGAAKLYGSFRGGKGTHASTVVRHATKGVRLADGTVLRLEAFRLGGRLMTSKQAVYRFAARQQVEATAEASPPRSPARRTASSAKADAELTRLGL